MKIEFYLGAKNLLIFFKFPYNYTNLDNKFALDGYFIIDNMNS